MNVDEFRKLLSNSGFDGPFDYRKDAKYIDNEHQHDFDVLALVIEGSITIVKPSGNVSCKEGETFSFPAGEPHLERPGPTGVTALIGRRWVTERQ